MLLALVTVVGLLSFRVKTIVGLFVTFAIMLLKFGKPLVVVTLAVVTPLALIILAPPVWWLISSDLDAYVFSESSRQQLTLGSVTVAAAHFPLGAGFGRFGSFFAAQFYSPEYRALGWSGIYGLGEGELGPFLMDTQWPAILGEAGWIGAVAFAGGVVAMVVSLARPTGPDEHPLVRWVRVAGIGWIILLVIESIAAPVFVSAPSYPFMFLAAGIVAAVRFDARDRGRLRHAAGSSRPPNARARTACEAPVTVSLIHGSPAAGGVTVSTIAPMTSGHLRPLSR